MQRLLYLTKILRRVKYFLVVVSIASASAFCSPASVIAGSGLLSSVGGVTFIQGATQFWVSQSQPTFSGITTAGSNVDVTIGGVKNGVVADASGNWSFTPTAALSGDNEITVATSDASITFTLTIGALPESIASAAGSTLSPAGSINPTIFFAGMGSLLLIIGAVGLKMSPRAKP